MGIDRKVLTFQVQRQINESQLEPLSAILPGVALSELWRIMGQFEKALLGITGFVVVTSLVGLVAVLLTLQAQRRQEVAILRLPGFARPHRGIARDRMHSAGHCGLRARDPGRSGRHRGS